MSGDAQPKAGKAWSSYWIADDEPSPSPYADTLNTPPLTVDVALQRALTSDDPLTRELARHLAHSRLCWQLLANNADAALAQRSGQGGQHVPGRALHGITPGALLALQADARIALDGPIARVTLDDLLAALDGVKG